MSAGEWERTNEIRAVQWIVGKNISGMPQWQWAVQQKWVLGHMEEWRDIELVHLQERDEA